jgi:hypothetical protein
MLADKLTFSWIVSKVIVKVYKIRWQDRSKSYLLSILSIYSSDLWDFDGSITLPYSHLFLFFLCIG